MFICICNALRDTDLQQAAADPNVTNAVGVFKNCDAKPQCGRCLPDVSQIVTATRAGAANSTTSFE